MKFYLELAHRTSKYRLKKDEKSWYKPTSDKLKDDDFTSSIVFKLVDLQTHGIVLHTDGKDWRIHPRGSSLSDTDILYYKVLVARNFYPIIPSKEQLRTVLLNGDDRVFNSLILNVYGFFELRNFHTLAIEINDPTIVFRHGTFSSHNGYVGKDITNDEVENYYTMMLEYWAIHLETGRTNMHSEDPSRTTLDEVLNRLDNISKEFEKLELESE